MTRPHPVEGRATDPREHIKCACPRLDGQDCVDFRSGRDLRRIMDAETAEDAMSDFDGGCSCACHEPDEVDE
jgi:hypothetical protein